MEEKIESYVPIGRSKSSIYVIQIPEKEDREGNSKVFQKIMAQNSPNLVKDINL